MAAKIRKNDQVIVIAGKDKGRQGAVLRIVDDGQRAYVEGINLVKKHTKPNPQQEQPGGIIEKEAPIHISKLALIDPTSNQASRVGFKLLEDGKKVRYFKRSGELVDV
ncbi:MAG: 50S ribosomal protein L24 [Legionellales bacterium]|nr:50S ribosomal protein L24 [Legionellales bacterium]